MFRGLGKKIKGIFLPVAATAATVVLYFNRRQVVNTVTALALTNPGTTMMVLMVFTDPMVIRIVKNILVILIF